MTTEIVPTTSTHSPIRHFFKSRSTWSLFVSAIAVVLSQSPPINLWFKGPRLAVQISKECYLGHFLGLPYINFTLDINNTGGRSVEVTSIDCLLRKSTGEITRLPIQSYNQSNSTNFPITAISLEPGKRWNAAVDGYDELADADEDQTQQIQAAIYKSINDQRVLMTASEAKWAPADGASVQKAIDFFNAHFKITEGQYTLFLALKSDDTVDAVVAYPVILFPHHIEYLRSLTSDYKWGSNVLPSSQQLHSDLKIVLNKPLPEGEARSAYLKIQ